MSMPPVKHYQGGPPPDEGQPPMGSQNGPVMVQEAAIEHEIFSESAIAEHAGNILHKIHAELIAIKLMLAKEYEQPEEIRFATLMPNNEIRLDRLGRRYILIYTPTTITNCTLNFQGLAGYQFSLSAGWTILNAPDGAFLSGPAGVTQAIAIKVSNWVQGSAI